jgi:hypothetical protein
MALPARDARPGLGERYGVAVNASTLELEHGRETALDRICDMAYARIEIAGAAVGEAERIAAELAPWLWRAAYGDDRRTAQTMACTGFTDWLMTKPYMAEIERVDRGIVHRFAGVVLHEWLSLRCRACGGGGWQGVTPTGKRVHASTLGRGALKAICLQCRGSGRPKTSPQLRMRMLSSAARNVERHEYMLLWCRQFVLGHLALRSISEQPRARLTAMRKGDEREATSSSRLQSGGT